jgi:hypothetical protein
MQLHPTPGCKAAHSSKAAHARTAGQTHCNVSLTVLAEHIEHGCPDQLK